jgi:hypothetical protein
MTTGFQGSTKAYRDRRGVVVVGCGRYLARPPGVADLVAVTLNCLCRRCWSAGMMVRLVWSAASSTTTWAPRHDTGAAGEATMLTTLDEIADGIYRISTLVPEVGPDGFTFNQFPLERKSLLYHTGMKGRAR